MTPGDCRCSILTCVDTCGIELHKVLACLNQTAMTNKTSGEALWACVSRRRLKEQQRPAEKRQWHRTSRIAHTCVVYNCSSNAQQASSVRKCHRFSLFNDLRNGLSFKLKWCRPNPRPQRLAGLELRKLKIVLSQNVGTSLISMIDILIICVGQESFSPAFSHSLSRIFVGSDLENLRSTYFARCFHIVESTLRISPCQKEFNRGSIQLQSWLYNFTIFHHCARYHLHACSWKRIRLLLVPRLKANSRDRNQGETGGLPLPPQLYL